MYMVQVPKNSMPCQVDDFPETCTRSRKGGIHFRNNSTIRITEDEYLHVLNHPRHGAFGKRLLVVHKGESKLEKTERLEKVKAAKPAPLKPLAVPKDTKPTKKSKDD
jgi:hypothetical protein